MPEIGVKDIKNQSIGTLALSDERFAVAGKEALMHEAVVNYQANQRQGTAATKTRGMVSGGGKKPWRQKGSGRARSGSNRSPVWRGGGTMFGPQPRDYGYRMPRKARRAALYAALSAKIADGEVVVLDSIPMEEPKTRKMVEIIEALGLGGQSLLIVLAQADDVVALSARNIPGVGVMVAPDLHAYDVLSPSRVVFTKDALQALDGEASK